MKTGLGSLSELAAELESLQTKKRDFVVRANDIAMDNVQTEAPSLNNPQPHKNLVLKFGDETVVPTEHAHNQIGQYLQIPAKYYDRMRVDSPDLLLDNVNHWLHRPQNKDARMIRAIENRCRAFFSNSYQRIDNYNVALETLPLLRNVPNLKVMSLELTERKMYIKAVRTDITAEVKSSQRVGDIIEAGVIISNSEIGMGTFSIEPFFHFLACTNGMVLNKHGMKKRHLGSRFNLNDSDPYAVLSDTTKQLQDKALLSEARDVLTAAMNRTFLDEAVQKMEAMTGRRIEGHVPAAVEAAGKILELSQEESAGVLRHLIEGGDLSQYGLMNAVTRLAEDLESYDRATELESLGGQIINLNNSEWKAIATAAA